jgi:hypothetical protein
MYAMGTITANVDDGIEAEFRKRVSQIYGTRKGALGKAFNEAMQEWSRQREYAKKCMELLHRGFNLGKKKYKTREDIHDRY